MEFTSKQKIAAYALVAVLVFGFIASTAASIATSSQSESESSDKHGQKTEAQAEKNNNKDQVDDTKVDATLGNDHENLSDLEPYGNGRPVVDAGMKHDDSVAIAQRSEAGNEHKDTGTALQSGNLNNECSAAMRASLEGYRDGLITVENRRWSESLKDRNNNTRNEDSESNSVSLSQLESDHKTRLSNIEKEFQHALKQSKCK